MTVSLIKVKSCEALLRMLPVCIGTYIKSVLRYKYLILATGHPNTSYLCEQGCGDPWLFFETKRVPRVKSLENTALGPSEKLPRSSFIVSNVGADIQIVMLHMSIGLLSILGSSFSFLVD